MKNRNFTYIIAFTSIFIFNFCQENQMEQIENIILEIKKNYAPDKRVAVFNITSENKNGNVLLSGETDNSEALNELVYQLKLNEINYELNVKMLPDKNLGDKKFGIINLSVANLRTELGHSAEMATQALLGTVVKVLKSENNWYMIQTPDKYISWVDEDGILCVTEDEMKNWKESEKAIITKSNSEVFYNPNEKSEKISDLVLGDILKIVKIDKEFTKVEFPDLRHGFVKSEDLQNFKLWQSDTTASVEKVIADSKNFIGIPYLWGGTSSKGVDCSGFTKTVFYMNRIILPRDASQQVNAGELVNTDSNFDNLQPGDLLFFGKKKSENQNEKITHVAIYLGDGKYIHSSGRVRYNSLFKDSDIFNEYRFNSFVKAKRILGNFDKGENLVKNNSFYN